MLNVLFVDDDANIRKLYDMMLQSAGFAVTMARDGNEAFVLALENPPDVAVLDVMMPGLHGYELCRRLRANPSTAKAKIIFLTARSQPIDQQSGMSAGADLFLSKPVMPNELIERIKTLAAAPSSAAVSATIPSAAPAAVPVEATRQEVARQEVAHPAVVAPPAAEARQEAVRLPDQPQGTLIACFSLMPQVGVTALSVNLAIAFALSRRTTVPLIELHTTPSGTLHAIGLESNPPAGDLVQIDQQTLEPYLVQHATGVRVLPSLNSSEQPADSWMKSAAAALRGHFALTIADVTSKPSPQAQAVLSMVDIMLLVTTPDPASLQSAYRAIEGLRKLQFIDSNILLVVNNVQPTAQVPVDKIQQGMKHQVFAVVPYSPHMSGALQAGKPLIMVDPRSPTSQAIGMMAVRIAKGLKLPGTEPKLPQE